VSLLPVSEVGRRETLKGHSLLDRLCVQREQEVLGRLAADGHDLLCALWRRAPEAPCLLHETQGVEAE
jgi:hypothetical protein